MKIKLLKIKQYLNQWMKVYPMAITNRKSNRTLLTRSIA